MPCAKGMNRCKALCAHRDMVRGYQAARRAYVLQCESQALGYATETQEYQEAHEPVTFKAWLVGLKIPEEWA